jgi:hypothetical protein
VGCVIFVSCFKNMRGGWLDGGIPPFAMDMVATFSPTIGAQPLGE